MGVIVLLAIIGSMGGQQNSGQSIPAASDKTVTEKAAEKAVPPSTPQVLLDISGNGSKTTQKFTAGGDWDLSWSYDCSKIGMEGNFQVFIYNGDASLSLHKS